MFSTKRSKFAAVALAALTLVGTASSAFADRNQYSRGRYMHRGHGYHHGWHHREWGPGRGWHHGWRNHGGRHHGYGYGHGGYGRY